MRLAALACVSPRTAARPSAPAAAPASRLAFLDRRTEYLPLTVDEGAYDDMAVHLMKGRGFVMDRLFMINTPGAPALYAGCAYPLFVGAVYFVCRGPHQLPLFLLQILLHALSAWLVFQTAARVAGRRAGAAAAAFFAFHPTLIWSSVVVMTEALAIPLTTALLWLLLRPRRFSLRSAAAAAYPAAVGAILALLSLTRSTFAWFFWIAGAILGRPRKSKSGWRSEPAAPIVMGLAMALVTVPWTIRNYIHWGRWIPYSTKSGVNAWLFNHPGLRPEFGAGSLIGDGRMPVEILGPEVQSLPDEPSRDAKLMGAFLRFVRNDPWTFLGLTGVRLATAILPIPQTTRSKTTLLAALYAKGSVLVALLLLLVLCRRRIALRLAPALAFMAYWTALQGVSAAGLRHRLPMDVPSAVVVGVALAVAWASRAPGDDRTALARRWLRNPPKG